MKGISVIIPVFNTGAFLGKCIESVLRQTLKPLEVILVDDGSSDDSGKICDSYAERYPSLISVIHQNNHGLGAARNVGIDIAKGDYLSFIDSDDYIDKDMYQTLFNAMIEEKADAAACEMVVETPEKEPYRRVSDNNIRLCWNTEEALIQLCSYRYLYASFCNGLYSRNVFESLRFPEGIRCEDYALHYQALAACEKVVYLSEAFYHYYQRDHSLSRTQSISMEPITISMKQLEFFKRKFPSIVWAAETDCVFSYMGIYTAYIRNEVGCPKELIKKLQNVCKMYLPSVLKNGYLLQVKKLQAVVFCCSARLYKYVVARKAHR